LRFPGQEAEQLGTGANGVTERSYNVHRWYRAGWGRYTQADPIGLAGGLALYSYAAGAPGSLVDPLGLDDTSPWWLGVEWATGTGPRSHYFTDGDPFTQLLQQHSHIQEVRDKVKSLLPRRCCTCNSTSFGDSSPYNLGGLAGVPKYFRDYSTLLTGGITGNLAVTYLGSYDLNYSITNVDCCAGSATVTFDAHNSSTIASGLRPPVIGYTPWWNQFVAAPLNGFLPTGPGSKTEQIIRWSETIRFTGNALCQ
jgi:RHS repeat-associated protein